MFVANYLAGGSASRYPAGTLVSGVFTDQFVAASSGDFTVRPDSILKGAAPDGSDIGVDYELLMERLEGVESGVSSGTPPPPPPPPTPPTAALTFNCTYLDCAFADTSTAGSAVITGRSWTFGDGITSTSLSGTYTYGAPGTYTVTLTVVDANGLSDSESTTVTVAAPPPVNAAPVAAFDYACADLTCTFTDRSTDGDGTITSWSWAFGTAGTGSTASPSFTFPAAGTYQVSLTIADDDGATSTVTRTVDVRTAIHLAFVAVSTTTGGNSTWKATVVTAVHTSNEQPVASATVAVSWSGAWNKTASCTTNGAGQCTFRTGSLSPQQTSITLTVTSVSAAAGTYDSSANHSQVAGGTGTSVTVRKP